MMTRYNETQNIEAGMSFPLGLTVNGDAVNFAVFSPDALGIDVCFFDQDDVETSCHRLPARTGDVWHGLIRNVKPGQHYGFRAHGAFDPTQGLWFNPNKVLIDPYAQEISARIEPNELMFAYDTRISGDIVLDKRDNAASIPKAVVPHNQKFEWTSKRPHTGWRETILYEVHVKGFSKNNSSVPEDIRGTYLGLAHPASIDHLKQLGITSVEVLPCFAFMSEHRLGELGLTNYWGYNPALFFAPEPRYAKQNAVIEFKTMVNALHEAGIEVILDVVYNHTAEGGFLGPSISNKGLHAREFYRHVDGDFSRYVDNSGCGNSVNSHNTHVLKMIMDSMRHWMSEYQIDGFRFDLAASMGREKWDFSPESAFFKTIAQDPLLSTGKMIAEPWDIGRGGYQLGQFPEQWYECNDKFRDTVRQFWKGDKGVTSDFATRLMGSSDVFHKGSMRYSATINYVSYHDGFTLHDLVSYNNRHNEANMERNLDGHGHNISYNYGAEGPTEDESINKLRQQQKRNFIATMMLSQGAIHFLGGDEFGRTQKGNNNAYCQDNDISWLQWEQRDTKLEAFTQQVIALRKSSSLFNDLVLKDQQTFQSPFTSDEVHWFRCDGKPIEIKNWHDPNMQAFAMLLSSDVEHPEENLDACDEYYLILFNASDKDEEVVLPSKPVAGWINVLDTARNGGMKTESQLKVEGNYSLLAHSVVVLAKGS